MSSLLTQYHQDGFIHFKGFFNPDDVAQVRQEAKQVFINQMIYQGILPSQTPDETQFEAAMTEFFRTDLAGFINCGKTCQHLISLHRLLKENYPEYYLENE